MWHTLPRHRVHHHSTHRILRHHPLLIRLSLLSFRLRRSLLPTRSHAIPAPEQTPRHQERNTRKPTLARSPERAHWPKHARSVPPPYRIQPLPPSDVNSNIYVGRRVVQIRHHQPLTHRVIPTGASRRRFLAFTSCERVGVRSGGTSLRSIHRCAPLATSDSSLRFSFQLSTVNCRHPPLPHSTPKIAPFEHLIRTVPTNNGIDISSNLRYHGSC